MASSRSGGVRVLSIAGRMARERERCIGMSDNERAWRAKFVKSQIVAPEEPIIPKGYYAEYYNPLRRLYRVPLNIFESTLVPVIGKDCAYVVRQITAKFIMGIIGMYSIWYHLKYNAATWMRKSGWIIMHSRETVFPGFEDYPNFKEKKPNEYYTLGFENSPI